MEDKKPDIVLIQPPGWSSQNPPLGLALLKSFLRENGLCAKIFDLNIILYNLRNKKYLDAWDLANGYYVWQRQSYVKEFFGFFSNEILGFIYSILKLEPEVIGISVHDSTFISAKLLALKFREFLPESRIIFGGPAVAQYTRKWEDFFSVRCADAVIFGEGEEALVEYLKQKNYLDGREVKGVVYRCKDGRIVSGEKREEISFLDSIPFADFSDFNLSLYVGDNVLPTYFSRGCINKCIYCIENKFFSKFRCRSGRRVYDEIVFQLSLNPRVRFFRMHDSISNGNIGELESFCDLIIKNKININFNLENATVRTEMDSMLYRKLKKAGCVLIGYGLETPSKPLLQAVGKNACLNADFDRVISEGVKVKLTIGINMMFGLPGESADDYENQLDFLNRHNKERKYLLINPALNFCYFPEGSSGYCEPDKYGIDLSLGELYWTEKNGCNTFAKRLEKFEQFCSLAKKLRYINLFNISVNNNKFEMLGLFYSKIGDYELSLDYLKKSFIGEIKTLELVEEILKIYEKLSLEKDEMYERIINYRAENSNKSYSINTLKSKEELKNFIVNLSATDEKNRIKGLIRESSPVFGFSLFNMRKFAKYILERVMQKENNRYEAIVKNMDLSGSLK